MATDFIEQLRQATFPLARRGGYDPEAVAAYLNELADWLETGGTDQSRAMLVQREMERVGERTGAILSAAQDTADRITSEAQEEADRVRREAEEAARELRGDAESYSSETRASADEHARTTTEAARREAEETRSEADERAKATIREAEARLQRAMEEAEERTRGVEEEIATLIRRRDAAKGALERVVTGLRATIDGPASEEIALPERGDREVQATGASGSVAAAGASSAPPAMSEALPPAEPTEPTEPVEDERPAVEIADDHTEVLQIQPEAGDEGDGANEGPEELGDYPFEAEHDEEERERRRRSVRDEQSTDDHLADFL